MAAVLELVNIVAADPVLVLDLLDRVMGHGILRVERGWFPGQLAGGLGHWPVLMICGLVAAFRDSPACGAFLVYGASEFRAVPDRVLHPAPVLAQLLPPG